LAAREGEATNRLHWREEHEVRDDDAARRRHRLERELRRQPRRRRRRPSSVCNDFQLNEIVPDLVKSLNPKPEGSEGPCRQVQKAHEPERILVTASSGGP